MPIFKHNCFRSFEKVFDAGFLRDLEKEKKEDDSSEIQPLGKKAFTFVKVLDEALTYRAKNKDTVNNMRKTRPSANFGDNGIRVGTSNAWNSLGVGQLPGSMQSKVPGYVNNLHPSISMGGGGYDYRPTRGGLLFHIKK